MKAKLKRAQLEISLLKQVQKGSMRDKTYTENKYKMFIGEALINAKLRIMALRAKLWRYT